MSGSSFYRMLGLALAAATAVSCSDSSPGVTPPDGLRVADGAVLANRRPAQIPASVGWQEQARTLVGTNNLSPLAAGRAYGALGVAQLRAVLAVRGGADDEDSDGGFEGRELREARRGAIGGASVQVLSFLFPAAATALEQRLSNEGGTSAPFATGVATGRLIGNAMVERLRTDRFTVPWTGTVPVGPGMWIANGPPAGATFSGVVTYTLRSSDQFRPAPPPAFNSAAFNADLAEIAALAVGRTAEQTSIAHLWNYPTGTFTPPGYWNLLTGTYVQEKGLNERAAARAFALTGAAMMDALIACWDAKYHYWTIRPSQANTAITLTFGLPNHPSYPSGHSCVSSSAATVLAHLFPKHADDVEAQMIEAGVSRMYAGIHYEFDITAGQELGKSVARWTLRHQRLLR